MSPVITVLAFDVSTQGIVRVGIRHRGCTQYAATMNDLLATLRREYATEMSETSNAVGC